MRNNGRAQRGERCKMQRREGERGEKERKRKKASQKVSSESGGGYAVGVPTQCAQYGGLLVMC